MNNFPNTHLHPIEKASALENRLRLFLQNPREIAFSSKSIRGFLSVDRFVTPKIPNVSCRQTLGGV